MMNQAIVDLMKQLGFPKEDIPVVIETGTHRGWGTEAFSKHFKQVYSIELSKELYDYCTETYKHIDNIRFQLGHSPEILTILSNHIKQKYFLFLDAHGSGGDTTFHEGVGRMGSPAIQEILACKNNPPEYIVIDDLQDFDLIPSYPKRPQMVEAAAQIGKYECSVINLYKGWLVFKKV